MSKGKRTIADVLRAAIERSGLTPCRIDKETGISASNLGRFVRGKSSIQLNSADRLAAYLGLRLVPNPDAVPAGPTPEDLARPTLATREPKPTMTDVLKDAIERSGLPCYRIAREAGIAESGLSRFLKGESSLHLKNADRLAAYLGLRLVPDPDRKRPRRTPKNRVRPMLAKWKAKPTMTNMLRAAIERSGLPCYQIARDAGISERGLLRFMAGDTSFHLENVDRLAAYLGLRLVPNPDAVPAGRPTPEDLARPTLATMTDVLKEAIERSGLTRYRIARDSGVLESSLSRFMNGERTLRLGKADVLAAYLGLRLVPDPDAKRPKRTPKHRAQPMLAKRTAK